MLQFKEDPKALMLALDRFLSEYYGNSQATQKLNTVNTSDWTIPDTLKYFYSFANKYPQLVDDQEGFFINDGKDPMNNDRGKLYIYESNIWTGFPRFFVKTKAKDPPVWVSYGRYYEPLRERFVCDSLSQFIATFSLKKSLFWKRYFYNFAKIGKRVELDNLLSAIQEQGYEVRLLWETNNYWDIVYKRTPRLDSFYSVENTILVCNNGLCATDYKNANRLLSSVISQLTQKIAL